MTPAEQLNPEYFTPERIARIQRTSPRTYAMHVLNLWGNAGNSLLTLDDLNAVTCSTLPEGTRYGNVMCGLDTSSLRHDRFAALFACFAHPSPEPVKKRLLPPDGSGLHPGIFVGYETDDIGLPVYVEQLHAPTLRVFQVLSWGAPQTTRLQTIVHDIASLCRRYKVSTIFADHFEQLGVGSMFSDHGIRYRSYHWTNESKDQAIAGTLKRMFREHTISLIPHHALRKDLLNIREIPIAGGRWQYPTHGLDCASALISMIHALNDPELVGLNTRAHAHLDETVKAHRGGRIDGGSR